MIVTLPPIHLFSHLQSHLFQVTRLPHVQGMSHWSINMSFPVSKLSHLNYSGFIINLDIWWVVVQLLSHVWLFATPWTAICQASLSFTISQNLLKLMSIESVMPSNHLIVCHPLLLLPSIFPSIRVFQMSQFVTSGVQSTGVSASAAALPINIQDWFPLGWTGWIFLQSKGLLRVFSNTTVWRHQ